MPSKNQLAGSLVLNNIKLTNVPVAVGVLNGPLVLQGTSSFRPMRVIESWVQGNTYEGSDSKGIFVQGEIASFKKPVSLLTGDGKIVGRAHPQYENVDVQEFVSVRDFGAAGDGKTDDTAMLQRVIDQVCYNLQF